MIAVLSDLFPYLLSTSQSPVTVAVLCIFFQSVECWELNLTCVLLLFRTHKQIVHCPCSTCVHVLSVCGGSSCFCNIMLCNAISWGPENGCAEQLPRPHQCDGCWALLHGCCVLLRDAVPYSMDAVPYSLVLFLTSCLSFLLFWFTSSGFCIEYKRLLFCNAKFIRFLLLCKPSYRVSFSTPKLIEGFQFSSSAYMDVLWFSVSLFFSLLPSSLPLLSFTFPLVCISVQFGNNSDVIGTRQVHRSPCPYST